jgi:multisubunit Na+/H+ antiporter MnhB subunit
MEENMIRKGVARLVTWFLILFVVCAFMAGVGVPGFAIGHEVIVSVWHGFLTLITGHSSVHLPSVKK